MIVVVGRLEVVVITANVRVSRHSIVQIQLLRNLFGSLRADSTIGGGHDSLLSGKPPACDLPSAC